ncbi:MAG: FliA/WhiG family RNA polymerase sigma factor [bacterium]|nr:FliA/WhiG family RNA polymerase sigma factor [bacterium]
MMDNTEFEKQVLDNLKIVKIIASRVYSRIPAGIEMDDLVHTGILGLIDAVRKYDPTRGTKFSTYASLRIRGAILDELRNLDWASRSLRQKIKEVENAFESLEIKMGRPPKEEEVADSLHMSLTEFHKLLDESRGVGVGVFRIAADDEGNVSGEKMLKLYMDEEDQSPVVVVEKEEMKKLIGKFLDELPKKEQLVLSLYYLEQLNLKEIGKIINLTESRISQIRTSAILRLRGKLTDLAEKNRVSPLEIV